MLRLLFAAMLLSPTVALGQADTDRYPRSLVGRWIWRGVDNSLEEQIIMLSLLAKGDANMIIQSSEELASGEEPHFATLTWSVEYPSWPSRSGRRLCLISSHNDPAS